MRRRRIIAGLLLLSLAAPLTAEAQQRPTVHPRIGWLVFGGPFSETSSGLEASLLQSLRALGYVDDKTLRIEYRYAEGQSRRLAELAAELARSKVDILTGMGGDVAAALQKATRTIPIVVAMSTDPVRSQLASSLARPGGNLTGITFLFDELAAKRVELFREMLPNGSRLTVLWDPSHVDNDFTEVQTAARRQNIKLQSLELHGPVDLDTTMQAAAKGRPETLIVVPSRLTAFLSKRIVDVATQQRIPVISGWREFAQDGAVMTYGPNRNEIAKRLAIYIDKIVKGVKPADLPIEQPTTFELVINLKTAKALGLIIPPSLLLRPDQVIE
jgi:putative ABC transport system substrate-binding protein